MKFKRFLDNKLIYIMRIKLKSSIIKELIPLVIVVIIALLIIPVKGAPVNNNTAKWIDASSKIFHGLSPEVTVPDILAARRPLFPIILASAFKLWGKTVQSASLATRIFFGLQIILIYLLGRIFYGKAVGLLSSGLVLTSYGVNLVACHIDTDIVLPFFILLFILIYYITLTRSSRIWAVFAGISLGLALMVKESALFCLGLPFGMVFLAPKGKRWTYAKLGFWVIGALIIPLVSWAIYMFLTNDSFLSTLDLAYQQLMWRINVYDRPFAYWTYLFTTGLPKTIFKYYQSFLQKVTPLSFLMIIGYIFVFFRGLIYKKKSDLILTILIVCSLPLILSHGDLGDRLGQTTFVYIFLYVILGTFVVSSIFLLMNYAVKFISKYKNFKIFDPTDRKYPRIISCLLIVFVGFFLIKAQLFNKNGSTWYEWKEGNYVLRIFDKTQFEVYGRYTIEQQEAAEWLKKNISENAKIIADGYTHEALDFFEVSDYEIPVFHPTSDVSVSRGSLRKREDNARPLYIITYSNFNRGSQRYRIIFPIFEEDIMTALKKENPDYLVISQRGLFFRAYFDQARWACLKFENRRVRIYEIHLDRFEPVIFENVGVNDTINEHLVWLEKNYPDEYLLFKEKIETLGLTIDELKNSSLRFPRGQVY